MTIPFDTAKPNMARMYDYWLGGKDNFARTYNAQDGARIYAHSWDEILALFDGLELVPPGLVETWQPGRPVAAREEQASMIVAGVGRRP